jgi:8-oxo-dGTP pyrophosphatase MutT (NUDIX family)
MLFPSDNRAYRFPVSLKGIVLVEGKLPLLFNERDEYELPGGKLEVNESPIECVAREIQEELNISVSVSNILDSWLYHITEETHVVIITYVCITNAVITDLKVSAEHKSLRLFDPKDIFDLCMPEGYKATIRRFLRDHYNE